jgi:hypothetical protein
MANVDQIVRLIISTKTSENLGLASDAANANLEIHEYPRSSADPPWAKAYEVFAQLGSERYLEAEIPARIPFERLTPMPSDETLALFGAPKCAFKKQSDVAPMGKAPGWHLEDEFSELSSARAFARDFVSRQSTTPRRIRIAHLDTGYDQNHHAIPENILREESWDFIKNKRYADDTGGFAIPTNNYGHGTATISILAGRAIPLLGNQPLGGAPDAEVLPLRISESVVLVHTDTPAKAVNYAIDHGCDVITMSMGGVASKFWVDAFNRAYESGVFCVCAAGNHLKLGPFATTPTNTVYPAVFNRVISATWIMANKASYNLPGRMSGNWGPHDKMRTSLAAYTPNIPWAEIGCPDIVSEDGAGTSSATPQIAAAAALWLTVHGAKFPDRDWKRAEAVRQALLQSAMPPGSHFEEFGRGTLKARKALDFVPQGLVIEPADVIWFPWLKAATGLGLAAVPQLAPANALEQMLNVEFAQLTLTDPGLIELLKNGANNLSPREQAAVRQYVAEESRLASPQLKNYIKTGTISPQAPPGAIRPPAEPPPPPPPETPEAPEAPPPPTGGSVYRNRWVAPMPQTRRVRVYALDPSYAIQKATVDLAETTLEIPWDEDLKPGPVDEYLEVIDFDLPSRIFYDPVDLNDQRLVIEDGLCPSPGNPRFHQQMVYAVARKTIDIFENALGRKIFWTGPPLKLEAPSSRYKTAANDDVFMQRLRIYPHAMRNPNAYYSQRKGSLLFGYFPSQDEDRFGGEFVFSCLSYDIVAHETTHAILDGMNRTLVIPTNPDVLAFHEAFADIVALFSRLQMQDIVANQIAATRGDFNSANIFGQLGREFGIGTGRFQALRTYLGRRMEEFSPITRRDPLSRYATDEEVAKAVAELGEQKSYDRKSVWQKTIPDPRLYKNTEADPHVRCIILVNAVYKALTSIYETRADNLLAIAKIIGPNGELPQPLVHLLSAELTKSAGQVLDMCIRAIDYLPPVDITFGDYLRAILTADFDLNRDDKLHYRVAFVEAFREWGIAVDGVTTSSEESLRWQTFNPGPFTDKANELARLLFDFVQEEFRSSSSRRDSFAVTRTWKWRVHDWFKQVFQDEPDFAALFGLPPNKRFYVRALRRIERIGPQNRILQQAMLQITCTEPLMDPRLAQASLKSYVTGGATLVVNTATPGIDYVITKTYNNSQRNEKAIQTALNLAESSLRSTYFSGSEVAGEPFAIVHEEEDE